MATTFQANEQNSFQQEFADTLISKLNVDSKFLNEIADRVISQASKNARIGPIKQKKPDTETRSTAPNKSQETNKNQESKANKKEVTPLRTTNKNEPLSVTNNTFKITNNSLKQETTKPAEPTATKEDTIFKRFLKAVDQTTNKLEQTVKKVPRPWELTPGTSMGYQMLKGKDNTIEEHIKKGLTQFLGRYITNIKAPVGYDTLGLEINERKPKEIIPFLKDMLKTVIKDNGPKLLGMPLQEYASDRDILYREMFDLPPRTTSKNLQKVAPKQYTLTKNQDNKISIAKQLNNKSAIGVHELLRGVYLSETKDKKNYQYNDKWDIVSSGGEDKKFQDLFKESKLQALMYTVKELQKGKTSSLRQLVSPLLKPATVSGLVSKEGMPVTQDINLTDDITKEVSNKIEQTPIVKTLTKSLNNFKNNKIIDGLKEMSSITPTVNPVISFLTTETPKKENDFNFTKTATSFNDFKELTEESVTTKINNWSTNLYKQYKNKIIDFTDSLDTTLKDIKKTNEFKVIKNPPESISANIAKNSESISVKPAKKSESISVKPATPSLKNTIDKESVTQINNNKVFDKIANNTETTNDAVKLLSQSIFKLAQAFISKNNTPNNKIIVAGSNNQQTQDYPPASQVAASNFDPIRAVRSQFIPGY